MFCVSVFLKACTPGGCVTSSASIATTQEDPPEGVPAPTVIALSPYSLFVTWSAPENPNGKHRLAKSSTLW